MVPQGPWQVPASIGWLVSNRPSPTILDGSLFYCSIVQPIHNGCPTKKSMPGKPNNGGAIMAGRELRPALFPETLREWWPLLQNQHNSWTERGRDYRPTRDGDGETNSVRGERGARGTAKQRLLIPLPKKPTVPLTATDCFSSTGLTRFRCPESDDFRPGGVCAST